MKNSIDELNRNDVTYGVVWMCIKQEMWKEYETVQLNTYCEQASQHDIQMKVVSPGDRRTVKEMWKTNVQR